jgi:hypothetical protein
VQSNKERWMELCELAAVETDSKKLIALTQEINRLLEEKQARLEGKKASAPGSSQNTP